MGMLDTLIGSVLQASGSSQTQQQQHSDIVSGLLGMINSPQIGGLAGLVSSFERSGLGDLVGKWVSTGPNPTPTAAQVQQGLGAGTIGALSQQLGLDPAQLTSHLATLLPVLVDKLTPNGKVEPQGAGGLLGALTGLLGQR
jgi:uncharacterized protein YidB (DUF937 family)